MRLVTVRRALAVTAALTMLSVPAISAESTAVSTDLAVVGGQITVNAGTVQPSQVIPLNLWFVLTCSGTEHVDPT